MEGKDTSIAQSIRFGCHPQPTTTFVQEGSQVVILVFICLKIASGIMVKLAITQYSLAISPSAETEKLRKLFL